MVQDYLQTLLDANIALGNQPEGTTGRGRWSRFPVLQDQVDKLTGELQARRRKMHEGARTMRSKPVTSSVNTGKTKDEEEGEYIENRYRKPSDSDDSDEVTDTEATNPKKDLSQRPDHYKTMKAEVLVVHDCDKDKLKAMGLEFIRYTRPVDQFDRISMNSRQEPLPLCLGT